MTSIINLSGGDNPISASARSWRRSTHSTYDKILHRLAQNRISGRRDQSAIERLHAGAARLSAAGRQSGPQAPWAAADARSCPAISPFPRASVRARGWPDSAKFPSSSPSCWRAFAGPGDAFRAGAQQEGLRRRSARRAGRRPVRPMAPLTPEPQIRRQRTQERRPGQHVSRGGAPSFRSFPHPAGGREEITCCTSGRIPDSRVRVRTPCSQAAYCCRRCRPARSSPRPARRTSKDRRAARSRSRPTCCLSVRWC